MSASRCRSSSPAPQDRRRSRCRGRSRDRPCGSAAGSAPARAYPPIYLSSPPRRIEGGRVCGHRRRRSRALPCTCDCSSCRAHQARFLLAPASTLAVPPSPSPFLLGSQRTIPWFLIHLDLCRAFRVLHTVSFFDSSISSALYSSRIVAAFSTSVDDQHAPARALVLHVSSRRTRKAPALTWKLACSVSTSRTQFRLKVSHFPGLPTGNACRSSPAWRSSV